VWKQDIFQTKKAGKKNKGRVKMTTKSEKNIEKTEEVMQELQIIEHNLQNILIQKQAFQIEIDDIDSAIEEIKKENKGEVYKILGQIIVKSEKGEVEKELQNKKDIFKLRLSALEKQEQILRENSEKLRSEIVKKLKHEH
jgi:prefoldin beta subunit